MSDSIGLKFKVGEQVVHPQHGVGYIASLEEKQFEPDSARMYYVIAIPDTTLWVPVESTTSGLRRLSGKGELDQCRLVLQSAPLELVSDRSLLAGLALRIKQGTIVAHCEVLRDLTAHGWRKSLFGPIADFKRMITNVLCQEWATVDEVSTFDANNEINALLKKGRAFYEH